VPLLRNATTNRIIATRIVRLSGFYRRAIGLLGRRSLEPDEGAWIAPCNAIHTIGMRVPIDVIFLDVRGCVVRLESCVLPNRPALMCRGAKAVIELGSGALYKSGLAVGDYLEMS
jgi:uncharacterized membrane protein (UPF0127 family)